MTTALAVHLNSTRVGLLEYSEPDEEYLFTFDEGYLADPERPILGQLFEDIKPGVLRTSGMPCWFAHLLPHWGLRRILIRSFGLNVDDEFGLLEALGGDLPGAVRLVEAAPRQRHHPTQA